MALKSRYAKAEEIPADQKPFYVEREGAWHLDAEGVVSKDKLEEFRRNNHKMENELEKFKDIDPAKYRELLAAQQKAEDEKLKAAGEFDKLLAQRTTAMKTDYEAKLATSEADKSKATKRLEQVLINDAISAAALEKGIRATALEDVKNRGKTVFKLDGDKVIALDEAGQQRFNTAGQPLSIKDWMDELATKAGHLFEDNRGGGTPPGGGGRQPAGTNPYKKGPTYNLTEQARLERTNAPLAKQMQAAAG